MKFAIIRNHDLAFVSFYSTNNEWHYSTDPLSVYLFDRNGLEIAIKEIQEANPEWIHTIIPIV